MTKKIPAFVGLDIETTGLDSKEGVILELGMVTFDTALNPITARSWITNEWDHHSGNIDDTVLAMHEKSGLIHDLIHNNHPTLAEVEAHALWWLRDNQAEGLPMLGSSITFDRDWITRHAPRLLSAFHYQSLDATSILLATRTQTPNHHRINELAGWHRERFLTALGMPEEQKQPHRVIYDICGSAALTIASMEVLRDLPAKDLHGQPGAA